MPQILTILVAKGTDTSLIYENEIQLKDHLGESHTYSLYGAVIHIAYDTNSGHYLSLLRRENSWIKFDDSKVTIVEELNYGEEGNFLFYQKVMQKSEDLKLRRSSRITKKETSSSRKVMQKSEDSKLRRSSRIAKIETSSSRKLTEECIDEVDDVGLILISLKGDRSFHGDVASMRTAANMEDVAVNVSVSIRIFLNTSKGGINTVRMSNLVLVQVGTAMVSSGRSERSDLRAAQVQIAKDVEAETALDATAEPSTQAEIGLRCLDPAAPSQSRDGVKAFLGNPSLPKDVAGMETAANIENLAVIVSSKHKEGTSITHPILLDEPELEDEPKPLSVYHPTVEELSASMGMPTEGFFDGVGTSFVTPPPSAATHGVPAEAPTSPTGSVPIEEGTHTGKVGEATVIPAETPLSKKKITPPAAVQTDATPPVTPLVISTSDPFAALSHAVKDGSSLVVTPSSIPSFATCGPDADLSFEGSEDILEDPEDEPVLKKRISDSDEEEGAAPETEFMETFEGLGVVANVGIASTIPPATPTVLVSAIPAAPIPAGSGPLPTAPSQFEVGSSSATVSDPVSEAAAFFTRFDQPEINELDPSNFWGFGPSYVDFHGFRVPEDCVSHLVMIYSNRGDFMQGFRLGRSTREHYLKMLGSVMNDIEHNFVNTVSTKRILQWRDAIQELVSVGFAVEFIVDHLREVARSVFMMRVQPAVDAIDTRIEILKKEVADLEGRRERLLSSIGGPSRFGDQTLIFGLR
uniref:USP domain-containing protein n=1 Tax=Quercus lobata TaxID=97700 RepID=A0A7N2ME85_QUELO